MQIREGTAIGFKHQQLGNTSQPNKKPKVKIKISHVFPAVPKTFKVAIKLRKRMGTWKLKNKADLRITSTENFDTGTWN